MSKFDAKLPHAMDRRQFLAGLGALASLAGCGSLGSDSAVLSGQAGNGGPGPVSPTGARVDTSQIGGSNLAIVAGLQPRATVGGDGSVVVTTSDTLAQVLFVMDGNGGLRGLSLKLPGEELAVNAATTALALVFLVPGIATSDPVLAEARIRLLKQAPSFPALVQRLTELLPTNTLTAILPQLQTLVGAVTREAAGVTPKIDPFTPGQAKTTQPGGLFLKPGSELSTATGSFDINNQSGRFVSVVRQLFTVRNQSAGAQRTNLVGGPLTDAVSTVGSVNQYSVGNFLTGQTFTPSHARDDFSLLEHNPPLDRAVYYMRGLGYLAHPDNAELPAEITANLFEDRADVATVLMNVLLPILEPVLAVAHVFKLAPHDIVHALEAGVTIAGMAGLQAAANTGDNDNFASALFDFAVTFFTNPVVLEQIAVLVGGGVVTTLVETAISPLLLMMSAANFLLTAADIRNRPRFVAIEARVPVPNFFDVISEATVSVLDVNALGEVLFQDQGSTFKKKAFNAPQLLTSDLDKAALSDEDEVIVFNRQSDNSIFLRTTAATGPVPYPPGFLPPFTSANPVIDARGGAVAANTRSAGVQDVFLHQRATGDSVALGFRSIPGAPDNVRIAGLSENVVFAFGRAPGHTFLARYLRASNTWVAQTLAKPNPSSFAQYVGVNEKDEAVLYEYHEFDDLLNPVRSEESILLEKPGGSISRVFFGGLNPGGPGSRPTPLGINDEGQILAIILTNDGGANSTIDSEIFDTRATVTTRAPLSNFLPNGAPPGPYLGLGIGGKYVAATRLVEGTPGATYLIFLGRTLEEVLRLFN